MRLQDIREGMVCRVRYGGARRPALVTRVQADGKVHVRFTDVTPGNAKGIPATNRGNLFGAVVRPRAISEPF